MLIVVPGLTAYMFDRLLSHKGWSDRPLTATPDYDWVDRAVGANASVAMAPASASTSAAVPRIGRARGCESPYSASACSCQISRRS